MHTDPNDFYPNAPTWTDAQLILLVDDVAILTATHDSDDADATMTIVQHLALSDVVSAGRQAYNELSVRTPCGSGNMRTPSQLARRHMANRGTYD